MMSDAITEQQMSDTERISVLIPKDLKKEFEEFCRQQRRSMSAQVVILIEQTLKEVKQEKE